MFEIEIYLTGRYGELGDGKLQTTDAHKRDKREASIQSVWMYFACDYPVKLSYLMWPLFHAESQ